MKNGVCPNCNGADVYKADGYPHQREMITISGTMFVKGAPPDRYVCVNCGFVEFYLTQPEHLQAIRDEWTKVPAQV